MRRFIAELPPLRGVYDLANVIAVTPATLPQKDANGQTAPLINAIFHMSGGQVLHTQVPFDLAQEAWRAYHADADTQLMNRLYGKFATHASDAPAGEAGQPPAPQPSSSGG